MVADLSNPRHFRRDCRDIIAALQFGDTFTREEIQGLVRQAGTLAAKAAKAGNGRNFKRAMDVLLKCAQVEQREKELLPAPQESSVIDVDVTKMTDEQLAILATLRDQLTLPAPAEGESE